MTVTGILLPSSPNTWVMPRFRPINPSFIAMAIPLDAMSELDFDVDAARQVELHQRVHRLGRRVENVDEALVRAHLELLARRLVDVRGAEHRPPVDDRRQEHGAGHAGPRAPHRLDD